MSRHTILQVSACSLFLLAACAEPAIRQENLCRDKPDTIRVGTYSGIIPYEYSGKFGENTIIKLNQDFTYEIKILSWYADNDVVSNGNLTWNGDVVTLENSNLFTKQFRFQDGKLFPVTVEKMKKEFYLGKFIIDTKITGKVWYLEALDSIKTLNEIRPYMAFESDGRIYGNYGCNRFSGFYCTGPSNKFTVPGLQQTLIGCVGETAQIEFQMMKVLNIANHYETGEDVLILFTCEKVLAKFKAGK